MSCVQIAYHKTRFGELIFGSYRDELCLCDWRYRAMRQSIDDRICKGLDAQYVEDRTPCIDNAIMQVDEYFQRERTTFDIPLRFVGTPFQQKVWQALCAIPYGTTSTYLKQAEKIGNKEAIRAVASANGANAISIIVPCHRIIGSDGSLIGYAGGVDVKYALLALEGIAIGIHEQQTALSL